MMRRLCCPYLLVLLLFFAACEGIADPAAACESFMLLQSVINREFTPEEFEGWVIGQYALDDPETIITGEIPRSPGTYAIKWQVAGYQYGAGLSKGKLTDVWVDREGSGEIRMRDLIACFGPPQFYHALHDVAIEGQNYQTFDLFFTNSGVLVIGYRLYSSASRVTRPITDDFPVLDFIIMQPGTVDEMLMQVYGNTTPYEYGAIRPWPETWEEIEIDITPYLQRLKEAP